MFRRILILTGAGIGLVLVAVLSLPWWLGGALRQIGNDRHFSFSSYENIGYGRWAVEGFSWKDGDVVLEADRIEAPHPLVWWWKKSESSPVKISQLLVVLSAKTSNEPAAPSEITGPRSALDAFHQIRPLLPPTVVSSLAVKWGEDREIRAENLALAGLDLTIAEVQAPGLRVEARFKFEDPTVPGFSGDQLVFEINDLENVWSLAGNLSNHRDQLDVRGEYLQQEFSLTSHFTEDLWIPDFMRFQAHDWMIPAAEFGLKESYESIRGQFDVVWREERFEEILLSARSESRDAQKYPPIEFSLRGNAGWESAVVEELQILIPGLTLSSSRAFEISRETAVAGLESELTAQVDLSQLPIGDWTGFLNGSATITTREDQWPTLEFDMQGAQIGLRDFPRLSGEVSAAVAWPDWKVETSPLSDEGGSEYQFRVSGNGIDRTISEGEWSGVIRPPSAAKWIEDKELSWATIHANGQFSGTFENLDHEGNLVARELEMKNFHPLSITGTWRGQGLQAEVEWEARAAEKNSARVVGRLSATQADLGLEILADEQRLLHTRRPVRISWEENLRIMELDMAGPDWELQSDSVAMDEGTVSLRMNDPDWSWLGTWLTTAPELPPVRSIDAQVSWGSSIVTGAVDFEGDIPLADGVVVQTQFSAKADENSVAVSAGKLGWADQPVATLEGVLPLRFRSKSPYWEIDDKAPIDARIKLERSPDLWRKLARESRVRVENPEFDLQLSGTWERPAGNGQLSIERVTVAPKPGETAWPIISRVEAILVDDGAGLAVEPLTARFDGQPITVRGQLPFTPEEWSKLSEAPMKYFREQGQGSISIPRAELSALAKFVPDMLVPTGQVEVMLAYAPGQGVDGKLVLQSAVTRPLGPLGALQDVTADLRFANRGLEVREVRALMGGQPVELVGGANWPESGEVELDLRLQGKNLPLVRSTGVLLRSDLDLRINSDATGAGEVSGDARLRDGLVLVDVRSLLPKGGGAAVPARRPPFFSVGVEPLNKWNVDVRVSGQDFLRLRTPVMTGTASVDVRLDGTLEAPRAIGDVRLEEGELRLPFARLNIDEAFAQLTEVDPYDPEIRLEATGQRLGYDLTFALSGKASDPRLDLQSSPTLTSEEVLLLVMAGVTPRREGQGDAANRALKLGMYFSQGVLGDLLGTDENGRLTVSTGEKLSRQGRETYRFDYELADRWNLVAEYDEFDHYNAAIKWRVKPGAASPPAKSDESDAAAEPEPEKQP
ncbi:MAG: hypothetical protein SynsKO_38630 [Synoicihabitans sp.]